MVVPAEKVSRSDGDALEATDIDRNSVSVHHRLRSLWLEGRIHACNHAASVPSHSIRLFFYRFVMKANRFGELRCLGATFASPTGLQMGRNSKINERL